MSMTTTTPGESLTSEPLTQPDLDHLARVLALSGGDLRVQGDGRMSLEVGHNMWIEATPVELYHRFVEDAVAAYSRRVKVEARLADEGGR